RAGQDRSEVVAHRTPIHGHLERREKSLRRYFTALNRRRNARRFHDQPQIENQPRHAGPGRFALGAGKAELAIKNQFWANSWKYRSGRPTRLGLRTDSTKDAYYYKQ